MRWQPISEAPKDGTDILIGCGKAWAKARWLEHCNHWHTPAGTQIAFDPTHFMLVTPPGEQQSESVNQRLLQAAERALLWIESDESTHGRQFGNWQRITSRNRRG